MLQPCRIAGIVLAVTMLVSNVASAQDAAPSGPPARFVPQTGTFDYVKRAVMIPMRDGVKLRTVILIPRGARNAPMILTRTPYGADARFGAASSHITMEEGQGDPADALVLEDGYIRVMQDVRGQHMSEGDYVMTRPFVGPLNPTTVDHSTDTYDTIDWLVKHVPESNGRVGMTGISYDGFTTLAALVHPHPALKAVAPINPMVDGWMGDDFFHYGAFRQVNLSYILDQESRGSGWWSSDYDMYTEALRAVSAGGYAQSRGLEQLEFWKKIAAHPAYDA
ncbi:MAG: CocE/NonD family hydrolase, partial [Candidatus Eremiobacteraeota bacterium]|nr:CocE/NonD family hydrolase [Candidatus Eremiobacteraeota bacterium]